MRKKPLSFSRLGATPLLARIMDPWRCVLTSQDQPRRPRPRRHERGAALLMVTFVMIVVLVGGLGSIALVNSELTGVRGQRAKTATEACAEAAVERLRGMLPNIPAFEDTAGTLQLGEDGTTLTYIAGHFATGGSEGGDDAKTIEELESTSFDASALSSGQNATNRLDGVGGGSGDSGNLLLGLHILRLTAVCEGDHYGRREVQVILRYGTPTN